MPILGENSSIESNYIHGHILSLIIHTNRLKKLECKFEPIGCGGVLYQDVHCNKLVQCMRCYTLPSFLHLPQISNT